MPFSGFCLQISCKAILHYSFMAAADSSSLAIRARAFSASMDSKPTESLLFGDFKDFHIADHDFGVSQITCIDSKRMMERKDEFLALMQKTMEERGYTLMILMLTDVLLEGTQLIYVGDDDTIQQAFGVTPKDGTVFLPRVMSRKKQIIPMLSALWG